MFVERLAIVGVGLIGGSVGLAARAAGAAGTVAGVDRRPDAVRRAVELGAVHRGFADVPAGVADADLVVVCTPVDRIADDVLAVAAAAPPHAVVTDVGSTKADIVRRLRRELPPHARFVGGHPMAGSEKGGVDHARPDMFRGRTVVLTDADPDAWQTVARFWASLGAAAVKMTADDHDAAVAQVSHLPHAVAAALAGLPAADLLDLAAGGFRDTTRIAAGDPELWAAIFASNRDAVLAAADRFADRLAEFRRLLSAGDTPGLVEWLAAAKRARDALGS